METFAQVISFTTSLRALELFNCGIGEKASEDIFHSLQKNTSSLVYFVYYEMKRIVDVWKCAYRIFFSYE